MNCVYFAEVPEEEEEGHDEQDDVAVAREHHTIHVYPALLIRHQAPSTVEYSSVHHAIQVRRTPTPAHYTPGSQYNTVEYRAVHQPVQVHPALLIRHQAPIVQYCRVQYITVHHPVHHP